MDRQRVIERRTTVSAVFLLAGYVSSLILEYASLHFVMTSDGYWRVQTASQVSPWLSLLAFLSLLLSLFPAFFFLPSLFKSRSKGWTGIEDEVHFKELLHYFALFQVGLGIVSIAYIFLPFPLFQKGTVGGILESFIGQFFMLVFALYMFKGRLYNLGFAKPRKWVLMLLSIGIFYLFNEFLLDELITFPLSEWLHFEVNSWREQQISGEVMNAKNIGWFTGMLDVAMVGIFVPIAEEMMFRGVLQTSLVQRFGAVAGILLSSFIFTLIHVDPVYFAPLFVMSLMLGWLRHYYRSIWASILFHAINNTISILAYYFQ